MHIQGSTHAVARAMAVVETHAPKGCACQDVQRQSVRSLWKYCLVQPHMALVQAQASISLDVEGIPTVSAISDQRAGAEGNGQCAVCQQLYPVISYCTLNAGVLSTIYNCRKWMIEFSASAFVLSKAVP